MKSIKIVTLALVAMFALGAVAASAAEPEHLYKIEKVELKAGETREIKSKANTEFVLKGKGALEIESVTKCKKLKLNEAEKPVIVGGVPGKSEKEKIEFEECTATVGGSKCSSVTIENTPTNNELVTIEAPAAKAGKLATLFTPAKGTVFTTIKLKSCGIFGSQEAKVEGTSAALVKNEKTEAEEGVLVWSEKEEITKIKKQSGTEESVGTKFNKKAATINGEAGVTLASKAKWGAF